ncbi:galactokinase family protein, partial [Candidatus Aerophobetes bacterium]
KKLGRPPLLIRFDFSFLFPLKFMCFRMEKSLSFVFEEIHNSRPEVVSSAPGRINIIGEDARAYFLNKEGKG